MITKNAKKSSFKKLAEAAASQVSLYLKLTGESVSQVLYARLTDDTISYGNFVVTITSEGYEAFRKKGDEYVPVSFHCNHDTGYRYEIWEGETYHISKREINYVDADEIVLWEVLWNLPHLGHYAFDPECI